MIIIIIISSSTKITNYVEKCKHLWKTKLVRNLPVAQTVWVYGFFQIPIPKYNQ